MTRHLRYTLFLITLTLIVSAESRTGDLETLANVRDFAKSGRSLVFTTVQGQRIRITAYGDFIVRVQSAKKGEDFFPDDWYEMVQQQPWTGNLRMTPKDSEYILETTAKNGISLRISRSPFRMTFLRKDKPVQLLSESSGIRWDGTMIFESFGYDSTEHFTGLGHTYLGRSSALDLKDSIEERNYGTRHGQQSPLIVPFYLSSKGYGIFLNSTFHNRFSFGAGKQYSFSIDGEGFGCRMDYFFILGPEFAKILDRYTQLSGRPRMPPKAVFGLGLSDKGNDENSSAPSDQRWWIRKVMQHRRAGFPIDHIINDNRWRAGGGKRCESYFAWDKGRYPDPADYQSWISLNDLFVTIDFNRCIASKSEGWKAAFNLPETKGIEFNDSAPDFTRPEVRQWFWQLFWNKSLNPKLHYPGDALWIDEFDELGAAPDSSILGNGRSWAEMGNYWFFLIAKALVQEGYDKSPDSTQRPFVWVRGMTAGAQRYATLWSGDIVPDYQEMKGQIRSMQLAGISGFPYWGHDAGGFYDWQNSTGPNENMYRQWSMAFGSFSPFWKPHGPGQSRWPLDRSPESQKDAKTYCELRYKLMPYTYTYAHQASETGMPMARAMLLEYQRDSVAWKHDLQYMWGHEILVAPNCSDSDNVQVWLPGGQWYEFWNDSVWNGGRIVNYPAPTGKLPLFVASGSIIPMTPRALSTIRLSRDTLILHVYTGKDASFTLYEDDGETEAYRTRGEKRTTEISFMQSSMSMSIAPSKGTYKSAPMYRAYQVEIHGLAKPMCIQLNGRQLPGYASLQQAVNSQEGVVWNPEARRLSVLIKRSPVSQAMILKGQECTK